MWAALALFSATAAAASSSAADRVTVESIHSLAARAKQWRLVGMPAATDTIRLTIAVSPRAGGVAELERALLSASDPKSPSYGKWLSSKDVQALTVGDAERSRVLAWLARAGGVQVVADEEGGGSSAPGFVAARLTVAAAEKLLQTKYGLWEHKETGKRVVRLVDNCKVTPIPTPSMKLTYPNSTLASLAPTDSVPTGVPVDFVAPTHRFPNVRAGATLEPVAADAGQQDGGCCYWRTPEVLRALYGVDDFIGHSGVLQHVTAFTEQCKDLTASLVPNP